MSNLESLRNSRLEERQRHTRRRETLHTRDRDKLKSRGAFTESQEPISAMHFLSGTSGSIFGGKK